jgi:hypothetical protein
VIRFGVLMGQDLLSPPNSRSPQNKGMGAERDRKRNQNGKLCLPITSLAQQKR